MKTADLIARLSEGVTPVAPGAARRLLSVPVLVGVVVAAAMVVLWLGMRPLDEAVRTGAFWMKAIYTLLLSVAAGSIALRAARPGVSPGRAPWLALIAIGLMLALSAREFLMADPDQRLALWLGGSSSRCPFRILALSVPVYLGAVLGMRRLAPTHPVRAGAAAGFLAGALAATAYQLFCPETGAMFVTTWYSLGIASATAVGAVAGAVLMRWRPGNA